MIQKYVNIPKFVTPGPTQVFLHELDLSSQESVRECAQKLVASLTRIDVLINNAGVSGDVCDEILPVFNWR